jgi:hypothetical protein
MKTILPFTAFALLTLSGCTDESNTIRTLEDSGYSNIQTTGYSWFECGDGDAFHTGFTATNPVGRRVSGTVCCGWMTKGCTIRF